MITIYDQSGHSARVVAESVAVWLAKGWTEAPPTEHSPAPPIELVVSSKSRARERATQSTAVTGLGESKVEGVVAPSKSVASARQKE